MNNDEAIKIVLNKLIRLGTKFSSEKYMYFVIEKIVRDLEGQVAFAKFIKVYPIFQVDEMVNIQNKNQITTFLNIIIAKLGVNMISVAFNDALTPQESLNLKDFGM